MIVHFPRSLTELSSFQKRAELDYLYMVDVSSELKMYDYLKTSNSIYHKACLFFYENLITLEWSKTYNIYCEDHHLFPRYLKNWINQNLVQATSKKLNMLQM